MGAARATRGVEYPVGSPETGKGAASSALYRANGPGAADAIPTKPAAPSSATAIAQLLSCRRLLIAGKLRITGLSDALPRPRTSLRLSEIAGQEREQRSLRGVARSSPRPSGQSIST